ncbi:MAG: hypothetical protein QT08_C0014G0007 [archaeon GW2011_AR17]|nr:MAG: hypothetical protein QT08_C0014G0007 [archaeon GW2011_AR17]MBS3154582.1 hypothetical protein [Candidatus Woesearchaeota archaeon]HIH14902.1 hypothetical protein [Nanoarchaeota archaeon]HIH58960.1 hypothetical protein [Nanoarchaeota archaeon]HII14213.1 hypothetical protein [Nanoarchaeota archaeon]
MGLLAIVLVFIGILIVLELFKHHFTKGLMKYLIVGIVLLFLLLIASAYIDFAALLGEGSTFASTGEVIAEGVRDDVKDIDIDKSETVQTISEKTKEFFQKLLE